MNGRALTQKQARDMQEKVKKEKRAAGKPEVWNLSLSKIDCMENGQQEIPKGIVLIRQNAEDGGQDQLFIDRFPVPDELWEYNEAEQKLRWRKLFGGGSLHLAAVGHGGSGMIGSSEEAVSVRVSSTARFLCDTAEGCGVIYIESGGKNIGMKWDSGNEAWEKGDWQEGRLKLEYTVSTPTVMDPSEIKLNFIDLQEKEEWKPGLYDASLHAGMSKGQFVWQMSFKGSDLDPSEALFPDWMELEEDIAAYSLTGALEVPVEDGTKKLYGIRGQRADNVINGYYKIQGTEKVFSVFHGELYIEGTRIKEAALWGNKLKWKDLSENHQAKSGLGASGSLLFQADGTGISGSDSVAVEGHVCRLSTDEAVQYLVSHGADNGDADFSQRFRELESDGLDIITLLGMTSFEQDKEGKWYDAIQSKISNDMSKIMNDAIPDDMWNLLFPNKTKPMLEKYLTEIKSKPVEGYGDPTKWYQEMGVAVLSSAMADGAYEGCKLLNGIRASKWLHTQTASSPVYYAHSQELFHYHWHEKYPMITTYLQDQELNWDTGEYEKQIEAKTEQGKKDIDKNVEEPEKEKVKNAIETHGEQEPEKSIKEQLKEEIQDCCDYAVKTKSYWAFAYYTYNTSPGILANIAYEIGHSTASADGMSLSRMIQQNVSVLTALDKTGYFPQKYVETINIFLTANILPGMFDFSGSLRDFTIIKAYIDKIFELYIGSQDKEISEALQKLKTELDKEGAEKTLKDAVELITEISGTVQDFLAYPYIAKKFVKAFSLRYPNLSFGAECLGTILLGGIGILSIFNIMTACKSWEQMNAEEKAETIIGATELGIQLVAAVVKRGVRSYAVFTAENLTKGQRWCGVFKLWGAGQAAEMESGMIKMSNGMARWLADTEGSLGKLAILDNTGAITGVMMRTGEQEATWVCKVLGRNLDEFIATRLGPIIILVGMSFSIYHLTQDLSALEEASEILNLCSGALMLFAIVGEWLISAGTITAGGLMATVIAGAGALAIIAAVVGVILLLCQMYQDPPDPVKEFIDKYAADAGFALSQQCGSLEYAFPYIDTKQNDLLMIGFKIWKENLLIMSKEKVWKVRGNGEIALEQKDNALPECVLQCTCDEYGRSKIYTLVYNAEKESMDCVYLSLIKDDNTLKFCESGKENATTQLWYNTLFLTTLTENNRYLKSALLVLQAAIKKEDGTYEKGGYVVIENDKAVYKNKIEKQILYMEMSGLAPNGMLMKDLEFISGKQPFKELVYSPSFGVTPSTPCGFTFTGSIMNDVKDFLSFDGETGIIKPIDSKIPQKKVKGVCSVKAENSLGSDETSFQITVK